MRISSVAISLLFLGFSSVHADGPAKVHVEICEGGLPEKQEWPKTAPAASEHYEADAFGFFHVPFRYIDTGVRADRSIPFLVRASADITLPPGQHRILLRARGAAKLRIDGTVLLTTPFVPVLTDGHSPIPTNYLDLGPDFRFAPPGNREKWTTFTSSGKTHRVMLETIVGGKRGNGIMRSELGETVAAISLAGSESFHLIAPAAKIAYTDAGWKVYEKAEMARLQSIEAERRERAFAEHAGEWTQRRAEGKQWLDRQPAIAVPALVKGMPANNPIDHFLAAKIEEAFTLGDKFKGDVDYHAEVKPILQAKCFSCHQGDKVKGKLRLDTLASARLGGASKIPAIISGQPEKSELIARLVTTESTDKMPPQGPGLTAAEIDTLRKWIRGGASYDPAGLKRRSLPGLADDLTFLRRATLDTVGVLPTLAEIDAFLTDKRADKRARVIDKLLADPRWADHWVSYWQDVLAENPNILNPTLNNTGPFRWWIHEALLDNKPMDLFVTELVRMRGSHSYGGPAGFAMASQNDAPLAEKAAIVASAFLGVQMKCARCHDAPGHKSTQKDLFSIAAMLNEAPLALPATSTVPIDKIHGKNRKPLITVSLKPGTKIAPAWPFKFLSSPVGRGGILPSPPGRGVGFRLPSPPGRGAGGEGEAGATKPTAKGRAPSPPAPLPGGEESKTRDDLARHITDVRNERFAQVMANRIWKRFMGLGIIEPVDDWENGQPSHPELLKWLGREFAANGYDMKQLARLILNSHAYQRSVDPSLKGADPYHIAHVPRRLTAEQIVDSLFHAVGRPMNTEEVSLDVDGARDIKNSISMGKPHRSWMFASTSNERDRPSLSLPRVQAVIDVLEAFGWRPSRQNPQTDRDDSPNVLQPALLANGVVGTWLTRLSDEHGITELALQSRSPEELVDQLFLRVYTRKPSADERASFAEHLRPGFAERVVKSPVIVPVKRTPPRYISWSNHLRPEANEIKIQLEAAARRGDPPTPRLTREWRERMEDVLWATLNSPEMIFTR